jgi:hypothetical protein
MEIKVFISYLWPSDNGIQSFLLNDRILLEPMVDHIDATSRIRLANPTPS